MIWRPFDEKLSKFVDYFQFTRKKEAIYFFFFLSKQKTFEFTSFFQSTCWIDTNGVRHQALLMMFDLLKNLKICQVFCLTLQAKTSNLCHNIWPFLSNLEEFTKKFTKFSFLKLGCCNLTLSKQKNNGSTNFDLF